MGEVLGHADDSSLMIVGEYHGNPGSITIYDPEGFCALSLHISLSTSGKPYPRSRQAGPSITGEGELASIFSELVKSDVDNGSSGLLKMVISDDLINFTEDDTILFSLKVRTYRILEGDGNCS
ncbi:hypothetical protein CUN85_03315 [Methanolobus halotolerans]|uniref:Uncharacterized protein n=2 Tax=Methanolobus halotolerans TaxID=2052935 RepID=A0A4E0PWN8_9EURY|nr:hypothetical protein CUN85_03315 [Methanolobus halotolerans]